VQASRNRGVSYRVDSFFDVRRTARFHRAF
jgi:hypothetical protein